METCFIISAFGDTNCDKVYEEVYVPICASLNLKPVRLDKVNDGSLVMNQIITNINDSEIIIADLTLARPNCYFEIGYAMGAKRESRVFLTCREDHNSASPNYKAEAHRIHFDVSGYDINFWEIDDLKKLHEQLEEKIKARRTSWTKIDATQHTTPKKPHSKRFDQIANSANKD
ncbi:hypothetical protein [Bdellovibrio bacteriovorus]|uniref:hypothetical protein n=1 Tax=Bdellovibrio bacteriovorus TaxID=959 RepID=UPI0035A5FB9C